MHDPYFFETPTTAARWKARAAAAYRQLRADTPASLRAGLTDAVRALTGQSLPPAAVIVDGEPPAAHATLGGVHFTWARSRLSLIRPCAHCAQGAFASQPLEGMADLGYALGVWEPLHLDCRPFEGDVWE